MILIYRYEEFESEMRRDIFNQLIAFFNVVKIDMGLHSVTDISKTLEILRDAKVKNIAIELSTEPSYVLGQIANIRNLSDINDINRFFQVLGSYGGCIIIGQSYIYGSSFRREFYPN